MNGGLRAEEEVDLTEAETKAIEIMEGVATEFGEMLDSIAADFAEFSELEALETLVQISDDVSFYMGVTWFLWGFLCAMVAACCGRWAFSGRRYPPKNST